MDRLNDLSFSPVVLFVTIAIAYKSFLFFSIFFRLAIGKAWQRCATAAFANSNPAMHARCARLAQLFIDTARTEDEI